MYVQNLVLQNFRCFGPQPMTLDLDPSLTAFVGVNGAGKTAAMDGLQRLFGISRTLRSVRATDFHVPAGETGRPRTRSLVIEAILAFPELAGDDDAPAVPGFFQHMTVDDAGVMKCRLRLEATWTDDGSVEGAVDETLFSVRTLGEHADDDLSPVKAADRSLVQLVYVPAARDADAQMRTFLQGRLWRAARWSDTVRNAFETTGKTLGEAFGGENPVGLVQNALQSRWREVHGSDHEAAPHVRALDARFEEFVRHAEVVLTPVHGRDRPLAELSDGQRSLFYLALTAATLDVEEAVVEQATDGFVRDDLPLPSLTLVAVEEPENSLAPYYLARTVAQLRDLSGRTRVQALLSSHSASIIARVDPREVRHFRLDPETRVARVQPVRLPDDDVEAEKYVREAIQAYPEIYFARFVVFGEGASEEIVLPRLARALNLDVDRSFVAIVPLGGRHVHHFWRLVHDLDVPHATLLDLDVGRHGGGWGRIKTTCQQLEEFGASPPDLYPAGLTPNVTGADGFDPLDPVDLDGLGRWTEHLQTFNVFFSSPLDVDYVMLNAFPTAYEHREPGGRGPADAEPRESVLGSHGQHDAYDAGHTDRLRWYRYLFLGRGKPTTHVRALQRLGDAELAQNAPDALRDLLTLAATQAARMPDAADTP